MSQEATQFSAPQPMNYGLALTVGVHKGKSETCSELRYSDGERVLTCVYGDSVAGGVRSEGQDLRRCLVPSVSVVGGGEAAVVAWGGEAAVVL